MKKPWAGWFVAILAVVAAFVIVMILAAVLGSPDGDPEKAGEQVGRRFGWILLLLPLVAYIVQKVRIDNWKAANEKVRKE